MRPLCSHKHGGLECLPCSTLLLKPLLTPFLFSLSSSLSPSLSRFLSLALCNLRPDYSSLEAVDFPYSGMESTSRLLLQLGTLLTELRRSIDRLGRTSLLVFSRPQLMVECRYMATTEHTHRKASMELIKAQPPPPTTSLPLPCDRDLVTY